MLTKDARLEEYIEQKLAAKIDPKELVSAKETARSFNIPLTRVLLDKSLITEATLGTTIAEYLQVPYVSLKNWPVSHETLAILPEDVARHQGAIVFAKEGETLSVGLLDPKNFETIDFLSKKTGLAIQPYLILENDFYEALNLYKINLRDEFKQIILNSIQTTAPVSSNLTQAAKEISVVTVLDTLLEYAIAEKASDIHVEGIEENVIIRFRIDGILHDMITLPKELQTALVARVKILSNLKIDEHRLPQDGRFKFDSSGVSIALRVSIIPAYFGENIVLRLLSESDRPKTLEELGLSGRNLSVIQKNIKKPHGMLLVTGPTGSGKTTTLYSVLTILNSPDVKICTVEDPIEYGFRRISQIQVNTKTGLTFAEGLRALLRHDPNIIMVGEIRDKETANISIQAALTGHLVLSTLHTNDAPSAIPRLLDLGAEGFLVASTVNVVIAQRLVRKTCRHCVALIQPRPELLEDISKLTGISLDELKTKNFSAGRGCANCHTTGYEGRMGIYETLEINDNLKDLMLKNSSVDTIRSAAIKNGMTSMLYDGLEKVLAGQTTLEEILRVARE